MSSVDGAHDIVVVGAGAIGCTVAWELARRGLSVTVVDRGPPGHGATGVAGGMLSPLAEARQNGAFLDLAMASFDRYAEFVEALRDATGIDVGYQEAAKLLVARSDVEVAALEETRSWQVEAGFAVDWLDGDAARRLEPGLTPKVRAGLLIARDGQVESRRLGAALWSAAAGAGARFHIGDPVVEIRADRDGRIAGVVLASGELLSTRTVVLAAGSWSSNLKGLPRPLPVAPVRGQIVEVQTVPPLLGRVVASGGCYLIPRRDGRLLIGATEERVGHRDEVTVGAIHALLTAGLDLLPALADAPVIATWSGFRPGTPDGLPVLGPDADMPGLHYATGHYRNGILLAPITGLLVAESVTGATPTLPLAPFGVERFGERVLR